MKDKNKKIISVALPITIVGIGLINIHVGFSIFFMCLLGFLTYTIISAMESLP